MVTRRTLLKGAGASILPSFSPAVSRAQSRQVVKFIPQSDLALLDPVQSPALVSRNHGLMVFDTLYGMDARGMASCMLPTQKHPSGPILPSFRRFVVRSGSG